MRNAMIYYISNIINCMRTTKNFFKPKLVIGGGHFAAINCKGALQSHNVRNRC